jgi:hypothetical protein
VHLNAHSKNTYVDLVHPKPLIINKTRGLRWAKRT